MEESKEIMSSSHNKTDAHNEFTVTVVACTKPVQVQARHNPRGVHTNLTPNQEATCNLSSLRETKSVFSHGVTLDM